MSEELALRAGAVTVAIPERRLFVAADPASVPKDGEIDAHLFRQGDPSWLLFKAGGRFLHLDDQELRFRRRVLLWACAAGQAPGVAPEQPKGGPELRAWDALLTPEMMKAWALAAGYDGYVTELDDVGETVAYRIFARRLPEWKVQREKETVHETGLLGYGSLAAAAEAVGNLRYDALARFLRALEGKLASDARLDRARRRPRLADRLHSAGLDVGDAATEIEAAWEICEPRMRGRIALSACDLRD